MLTKLTKRGGHRNTTDPFTSMCNARAKHLRRSDVFSHNSPTDSVRVLSEPSKDAESLPVSIKKRFGTFKVELSVG